MADIVSPEQRGRMMSGIRSKDTRPELIVRKALFHRGFRYRLHLKSLAGTPDLTFPKHKAVIFINGCFWHQHDCELFKWPKSNKEFWREKLVKNRLRDQQNHHLLSLGGWKIFAIWECSIKGRSTDDINRMLDDVSDWLVCGSRESVVDARDR